MDCLAQETKMVTFNIPIRDLAYQGLEKTPVLEPGEFDIMVGNLTERILVR